MHFPIRDDRGTTVPTFSQDINTPFCRGLAHRRNYGLMRLTRARSSFPGMSVILANIGQRTYWMGSSAHSSPHCWSAAPAVWSWTRRRASRRTPACTATRPATSSRPATYTGHLLSRRFLFSWDSDHTWSCKRRVQSKRMFASFWESDKI